MHTQNTGCYSLNMPLKNGSATRAERHSNESMQFTATYEKSFSFYTYSKYPMLTCNTIQ